MAIVRRLLDSYALGEVETGLVDPDFIWNPAEEPPVQGLDAARAATERWESTWENLETTPEGLVDAGDKVLVTTRFSGRGKQSGIEVEARMYEVYTLRDGKVIRMDEFTERSEALEAAGLRE